MTLTRGCLFYWRDPRSRNQIFVLSVLCRKEKSLYASTCDAPSTAFNSQFSYLPPTPPPHPNPAGLSWKHNKDILSGIHLGSPDWRGWIWFFQTPPFFFPPCHGTQGCHYNGCRPHPFIILLTYETKHIYIKRSYLPSSLNHTMFCCVEWKPPQIWTWAAGGGGGGGGEGALNTPIHAWTLNFDIESAPSLRRLQLLYVYVEYTLPEYKIH